MHPSFIFHGFPTLPLVDAEQLASMQNVLYEMGSEDFMCRVP